MSDPPVLVKPARLSPGLPATALPPRSRSADDFLNHLEPATVVDALASPNGGLRSCLDDASLGQQEFAMRTALASQRIWEWLNELRAWHWASEAGPQGFQEDASRTRRKLFINVVSPDDDSQHYIGCLLAGDVTRYETRIAEINRDLDQLGLEDIKSHVLADHILPLSKPAIPIFDPNRSFVSSLVASCNKLDDLSAVVTAIVVQTLPNLARLSHLLQTWSTRIAVLQQIDPLLAAIEDAEALLQENWVALSKFPQNITRKITKHAAPRRFFLTREAFEAKRDALAQKVAQPGRTVDFMLDCLEDSLDTLPDEWLSRLEDVEQGYGEWVAACERWFADAEWAKSRQSSPSPANGRASKRDARRTGGASSASSSSDALVEPVPLRPAPLSRLGSDFKAGSSKLSNSSSETDEYIPERGHPPSKKGESEPVSALPRQNPAAGNRNTRPHTSRPLYRIDNPIDDSRGTERTGSSHLWIDDYGAHDDGMTTVHEETEEDEDGDDEEDEEDALELPPLRHSTRRDSSVSQTSTIVHGTSKYLEDFASDFPDVSTSPATRKGRFRGASDTEQYSPRSSPPPEPRRRRLAELLDSPIITGDNSLFKPTLNDSYFDDEEDSYALSDTGELRFRRDSVGDVQFRERMYKIIESIPASIRLSNQLPRINLNPPDLQLPQLKKMPSTEHIRQSNSGMSTRTNTPLFTLSPVKGARSRNRGHQEIRVYHLSRSNGDPPIKLFIRCVGENGERVMVRVGGGWADLGEYLKEYVSHHGRRSSGKDKANNVEVRQLKRNSVTAYTTTGGSSPPSRPASVSGDRSPISPLNLRKTRRSVGEVPRSFRPKTPASLGLGQQDTPPSDFSGRSRSSSHTWQEDESSFLGLAGPTGKKIDLSEENRAWVESVKEKVRMTSGDMRTRASDRFGELGKVGGTKRVYRKGL